MSYCRFFEADAYIFNSTLNGVEGIECCGCALIGETFHTPDLAEFLAHIKAHRDAGHDLPDELEAELTADHA